MTRAATQRHAGRTPRAERKRAPQPPAIGDGPGERCCTEPDTHAPGRCMRALARSFCRICVCVCDPACVDAAACPSGDRD